MESRGVRVNKESNEKGSHQVEREAVPRKDGRRRWRKLVVAGLDAHPGELGAKKVQQAVKATHCSFLKEFMRLFGVDGTIIFVCIYREVKSSWHVYEKLCCV